MPACLLQEHAAQVLNSLLQGRILRLQWLALIRSAWWGGTALG